jgi:drug/metabolite transporter (DMT)-like permease
VNTPRKATTQRLAGYLMVVTASFLFGFNGNLSRRLFDSGVTPVTLVEFRMLIGGACLLAVLVVGRRRELKLQRRHWGWVIALGLSVALVTYTYFVAISRLPIAVALVIQFTAPAWMTLGEVIWYRRMPSIYVLGALGLTIVGVVLLTGLWRQSLNGLDPIGLLYAGLALLAFIAYLLLGRRVGRDLPSLTSTAYSAIVAGIFWLIVQPPWAIPPDTWTPQHLPWIILVGIIGMAIPFSLVFASLRRIDATRVGIVSMLELVFAGVIAYFWLGQLLDVWQIAGGLAVLVGVTILQIEARIGQSATLPGEVV